MDSVARFDNKEEGGGWWWLTTGTCTRTCTWESSDQNRTIFLVCLSKVLLIFGSLLIEESGFVMIPNRTRNNKRQGKVIRFPPDKTVLSLDLVKKCSDKNCDENWNC